MIREFECETCFPISLTTLKGIYNCQDTDQAINLLQKCTCVQLNQSCVIPNDDLDLLWNCENFFLDYLLLVSAKIGMHAILCNVNEELGYIFQLKLNQPHHVFRTKYTWLRFDSTNQMLFLGWQGSDTVWLAMAPCQVLRVNSEDVSIRTCKGTTTMNTLHYHIVILWLAYIMRNLEHLLGWTIHRKHWFNVQFKDPNKHTVSTLSSCDGDI